MKFTSDKPKLDHVMKLPTTPEAYSAFDIPISFKYLYTLEGEKGEVFTQRIRVREYVIWLHVININKRMEAREVQTILHPTPSKSIFTLHYMLQNRVMAKLQQHGEVELREGEYNMFFVPPIQHDAYFDPGTYVCFHIDLPPHLLQRVESELPLLMYLLRMIEANNGGTINEEPYWIDSAVRSCIDEIIHCKLSGEAGRAFLYTRCQDLFMHFLEDFTDITPSPEEPKYELTDKDTAAIYGVRAYILQHLHLRFTFDELAERFGIMADKLRYGFPRMFYRKMAMFLKEQRMIRSMELVKTTRLDMSIIANMVGYKDVEEFSQAFKQYYGCCPLQEKRH